MAEQAFDDIGSQEVERRPAGRKITRPRHAATLILIRRDGPRLRVLMGRRHGGHDFMPEKWVFPGGRVEAADHKAQSASDLLPIVKRRLSSLARGGSPKALAMAAVRETFEEAGLLLAKPVVGARANGPWREFAERGVAPDLAKMDFVARAITPPMAPKRFDARFFLADARDLVSLEREADCGELSEVAWLELQEALTLELPSVTRFVLKELPRRLTEPGLPASFLRFTRGRQMLTQI